MTFTRMQPACQGELSYRLEAPRKLNGSTCDLCDLCTPCQNEQDNEANQQSTDKPKQVCMHVTNSQASTKAYADT